MTSATLIYSPHLNEIPPQKRGLTGAPYTTNFAKKTPCTFPLDINLETDNPSKTNYPSVSTS